MYGLSRVVVLVFLLAGGLAAGERKWSLPDDPQAVVVELKHGMTDDSISSLPTEVQNRLQSPRHTVVVRIRRNGAIEAGSRGSAGYAAGQLTEAELAALLEELIERQGATELSTAALENKIQQRARETRKDVGFAGSEMVVCITLQDGRHEFRCCSPEPLRTRFPEVRELNRVCAIVQRLENIAAVAQVGGPAEAERLAKLATAELRRQNGTQVEITAADLRQVRGSAGDLRQLQFVVDPALRGEAGTGMHVSVIESPGTAPRISMTPATGPL